MGNYWSTVSVPRKYGWSKPQQPATHRIRKLNVTPAPNLPPVVDHRDYFDYVFDQGSLGSCVANATDAALGVALKNSGLPDKTVRSRLYIYFNARAIDGDIHSDSGTTICAAIQAIENKGACAETEWPYLPPKFILPPPPTCYANGKPYGNIIAHSLDQTLDQLKQALANGNVICLGIMVYASFESQETAKTGVVQMPQPNEAILGGHAIVLVGYNEEQQGFIFRNSWGVAWGDKGYGYIPYSYILNPEISADFWVIDKYNA